MAFFRNRSVSMAQLLIAGTIVLILALLKAWRR
jgi:hypothetical protein